MDVSSISRIVSYHAHIYFKDAEERETASALREAIAARFAVKLGRWRKDPVGPHERPMYQVAFSPEVFATFLPWLMLNRRGLAILIHPNTGAPRRDHQVHALWLGEILAIMRPEDLPETSDATEDLVVPDTTPNTALLP
jgi:DOPA 4,5-dioxygenase